MPTFFVFLKGRRFLVSSNTLHCAIAFVYLIRFKSVFDGTYAIFYFILAVYSNVDRYLFYNSNNRLSDS